MVKGMTLKLMAVKKGLLLLLCLTLVPSSVTSVVNVLSIAHTVTPQDVSWSLSLNVMRSTPFTFLQIYCPGWLFSPMSK